MKVIFLDFDGVLNTNGVESQTKPPKWAKEKFGNFVWLDGPLVEIFKRVFDHPELKDTKIVISSTWRLTFDIEELRIILNEWGIGDRIIGVTKNLNIGRSFQRGVEVAEWLEEHPEVTHWAIIDDNNWFFADQQDKLVWTNGFRGINSQDVQSLITILTLVNVKEPKSE